MAGKDPLFDYDAGYYEVTKDFWLPGKLVHPKAFGTWTRRAVDAAVNMELDDSDVIMAAYPKTGQTWLMTTIHLITMAEQLEKGNDYDPVDIFHKMPFIEAELADGTLSADIAAKLPPPRYYKSHLPFSLWRKNIEKHPDIKIIQTIRNPKDTLVSFYHHYRSDGAGGAFNGTWDQYFERFRGRKLIWGDLFQVTSDWYKFNKDRPNSLVLSYEDGKKDPRGRIVKIAKFMGFDLSEKVIDIILEKSTIKNMSQKYKKLHEGDTSWNTDRSSFIRKGQVGDWINYFTKEQNEYVENRTREEFEPLGLKFEYSG